MPAGYIADTGVAYGSRANGLSYGWNQDNTANARDRDSTRSPDELHDGLIHLQKPNNPNASWKTALPNGTYSVHLLAGDPDNIDSVYKINVQNVLTINGTPTTSKRWFENTVSVAVTNGSLVISNATGSSNNKLNVIDIKQTGEVHLAIAHQPSDTTAGTAIGPAVTVSLVDDSGNVIANANLKVTVTIAAGPGSFTKGSTLTVSLKKGVATFSNLVLTTAGSYTLQVTAGTLDPITSNAFDVDPAQADHLVFLQQPTDTAAGQTISAFSVAVVDQFGNIVTNDNSTVTISIASGPGTFIGGSTLTVAVHNGIATFDNLALDIAGTYTLEVLDGSLTGAISDPFKVT
jgi:hypothetical protein